MTIPIERARAISNVKKIAEDFCLLLRNRGAKVSDYKALATTLCMCLRHYPNNFDLKEMARYAPDSIEVEGVEPQSGINEETERNAARYLLLKNSLSSPDQMCHARSHTRMPQIAVPFSMLEQTYTREGLDKILDELIEEMR